MTVKVAFSATPCQQVIYLAGMYYYRMSLTCLLAVGGGLENKIDNPAVKGAGNMVITR
ncbi:hypothetical protein ACFLVF_01310 [Chloroflexota bacterium]